MKLILTAITLFFSVVCFSQTISDTNESIFQKSDTTKPKQYFLIGQIENWQLLFKAVNEPGKVTRDEIVGLSQWINSIRELQTDTTSKPKKEGK